MKSDDLVKAYRRDLDRVLLTGDAKKLRNFFIERGLKPPPYGALSTTMHKAITGSTSLPIEYRRASKAWLTRRGYHSLDDGDL